jgi:hypothetical protein
MRYSSGSSSLNRAIGSPPVWLSGLTAGVEKQQNHVVILASNPLVRSVEMDFYEVIDQVLAILQSRGRVTYQALRRQFNLDNDFLEDLKADARDLCTERVHVGDHRKAMQRAC